MPRCLTRSPASPYPLSVALSLYDARPRPVTALPTGATCRHGGNKSQAKQDGDGSDCLLHALPAVSVSSPSSCSHSSSPISVSQSRSAVLRSGFQIFAYVIGKPAQGYALVAGKFDSDTGGLSHCALCGLFGLNHRTLEILSYRRQARKPIFERVRHALPEGVVPLLAEP